MRLVYSHAPRWLELGSLYSQPPKCWVLVLVREHPVLPPLLPSPSPGGPGTRPNGETGLFPEAYVEEVQEELRTIEDAIAETQSQIPRASAARAGRT